ncbi:MAG: penicillin acylase family protein [Saprospiraceae bacterium]
MRTFVFFISLILTIAMTWLLSNPVKYDAQKPAIPPLGNLFNPFTGFWQNGEQVTFETKTYDFNGLDKNVNIVFDDRLVPHIFAEKENDAYFAQGYVTAMHRLFQMDLSTRHASGRLSEVLGDKQLNRDKLSRRKGMVFGAMNTLEVWKKSPEAYAKLEAFTAGVNAYINNLKPKDYPVEFKLLNYIPEAWTPLKTSLMLKSMAQTLCMRNEDIEASNTLATFGKETFDLLYSDNNPKESPIIPADVEWNFKGLFGDTTSLSSLNYLPLPRLMEEPQPDGIGSNNWAVATERTNSKGPILCNDPHLPLTLPSVWYEVHLHSPELNVYGVSLPGVPGVMIGFNENVAWGMTNVAHDVLDWYQINWAEASKSSYFYDGKLKEVDNVIEQYDVLGLGTVYDTVKYTVWGPVVYESKGHSKQDLAMRWIAHFAPEESEILIINRLNKAKNYDDYAAALKPYSAPAQNFVFASRDGDIALKVQGRFPNKKKMQGRFVQDGSRSSSDWQGFIPEAHNPAVKNPKRGFVSSANQRSTANNYPYYYNGRFEDYRGRVLNSFLEKMDNVTVKEMMDLQNNTFSLKAKEALAVMLPMIERKNLSQQERDYFKTLDEWNYHYDADAKAPILFEKWFSEFYKQTWDEMTAVAQNKDILWPEHWRTIALMEGQPTHDFFDNKNTPVKETAKNIANTTFLTMCAQVANMEQSSEVFTWKDKMNFKIPHLLRTPFFGKSGFSIGGSPSALNAMNPNGFGPSWRMVVSFDDELKAYGVYPGGQSGNPGSVYYDNMIAPWAKGDYFELLFVNKAEDLKDRILYQINLN